MITANLTHRRRAIRRGRRAFTLLELLVVGMLGVLVLTILGNASRWYARSVGDIQTSGILSRELKIATDAIAQDFGPALAVRTPDSSTLQIDVDGGSLDGVADWQSPDSVIEYIVQDNQLLRRDLRAGTEIPLARHIVSMEAETVDGNVELHLLARIRHTDLTITLQLQGT